MVLTAFYIAGLVLPFSAYAVCPFLTVGTPRIADTPVTVPEEAAYVGALNHLDVGAVFEDIMALLSDSQSCWPADSF
eukprot:CAMPEP_0202694482 /NCGR_PEP_ID=MMETSP1385-20130828/8339_1 /ASSEMBLY_ACC=CAM_ASM_000861 /TAXON_ID=933848 /ORGANISM="Elphidium margaritaceum" /LENGTH=76 /DNA_ID=CAMNT_0049350339 /DNA_START=68 /DNA_END=295 /DNA_ORIENTATION=+